MAIKNVESLEARAERRAQARKKKGRPKMKVSGAGVKRLQKIMQGK